MYLYIKLNNNGEIEETLVTISDTNTETITGNGVKYRRKHIVQNIKPFGIVNAYQKELSIGTFDGKILVDHQPVYDRLGLGELGVRDSARHTEESIYRSAWCVRDLKEIFDRWVYSPKADRSTTQQRFRLPDSVQAAVVSAGGVIIGGYGSMLARSMNELEKDNSDRNDDERLLGAWHTMLAFMDNTSCQPTPYFINRESSIRSNQKTKKEVHHFIKVTPSYGKLYHSLPYNKSPDSKFSNGGLFELAWAELSFALENNISARICGEGTNFGCGDIYQRNSGGRRLYCSEKCALTK